MSKIKLFFSIILLFFYQLIQAQVKDTSASYIISGTVVNGESNELLIGAHIVSSRQYGTKTDETGVFTINVKENDTIRISHIGYKTMRYIAPTQENGKYLIKFKLYTDSITLQEVEIFPWPTYGEFKKAFAELKSKEPEIKMEGVKMYQDRNIEPWEFPTLSILTNPISFMYDKLLDKKAKQLRRINRNRKTIKESSFTEDED